MAPFGDSHVLDRDDWELGKDMLYDEFGWDRATGLPTPATYDRLGLATWRPPWRQRGCCRKREESPASQVFPYGKINAEKMASETGYSEATGKDQVEGIKAKEIVAEPTVEEIKAKIAKGPADAKTRR